MLPAKIRIFFILFFITISLQLYAKNTNRFSVYHNIIEKKIIKIGISKHYPPLNYEAGKKGVEIAMSRKLGKFLGVKIQFIPLNVKNFVKALKNGKIDIIIAGFSRNLKRAKDIWFSMPYLTITPAVLSLKQSIPKTKFGDEFGEVFEQNPIKTLWDLRNVSHFRFAVKKGSSYEQLLKDKMPGVRKILVDSNNDGFKLLKMRKVDGFVHDSLYLEYIYKNSAKYRRSYVLLKGGRQTEKICIGLPFGDVILKNQADIFIAEIIRQGYIEKWLKIYNEN